MRLLALLGGSLEGESYVVAAAMHVQFGGQCDGTAEEEQGVEEVEDCRKEGVAWGALGPCGEEEVEEGQHAEDCDKHGVVDDGGVAVKGVGDNVAHEGHYEESPKELQPRSSVIGSGSRVSCCGAHL